MGKPWQGEGELALLISILASHAHTNQSLEQVTIAPGNLFSHLSSEGVHQEHLKADVQL